MNFDDTRLRNPLGKKTRGHCMPPGTGPQGQTCGTCKHIVRFARYRKCGLCRSLWTGGPGTDILAEDAACSKWEAVDGQ